jgi:glucosamine 6-phosphate synthetase-like amidotransferase/phosphosugar isomerase protein
MCGIFGFITKQGRRPDLARLRRIAAETESRGRHAFGLAWIGSDGRLYSYKRPGSATDDLGSLERCRDALAVIGHCRFATHGSPNDNANNHPHRAGRGWLVHNGVVFNHSELAARYRLALRTRCDSEVLALLLARIPGSIAQRGARVANLAEGPLAMLGLWNQPARLLLVRRDRPISFGETRGGIYFGSLPGELPGRPQSVPERLAHLIVFQHGQLSHAACGL